jgi:hypothetical protein
MEHPELIDFVDLASGRLDEFMYSYSLLECDDRKRDFPDIAENSNKRPYALRKVYNGRDPRTSFWSLDHMKDEFRTWRDLTHINGKLFRHRFSHNFESVNWIVAKMQRKGHYFLLVIARVGEISDHASGFPGIPRSRFYPNYVSWTCVPDIIPKGIFVLHISQHPPNVSSTQAGGEAHSRVLVKTSHYSN